MLFAIRSLLLGLLSGVWYGCVDDIAADYKVSQRPVPGVLLLVMRSLLLLVSWLLFAFVEVACAEVVTVSVPLLVTVGLLESVVVVVPPGMMVMEGVVEAPSVLPAEAAALADTLAV